MVTLNSEIKERDFSNSPELEAVQKKAIAQASRDTGEMLDRYNKHPDTFGGRYICADTFKELFVEFENKEDRAKVNNAIHNSAAVLSATQFDEVLKREEPDKTAAIFITGIPGSGKTTTVTKAMMSDQVKLVFEGQLANPEPAFKKIDSCLEKGLSVTIAAVHIDAEKSLANTFKRFNEYGRGASIGIMAEIQGKMVEGLSQIRERYGDQITIVGFDQNQQSRLMTDWEDIAKTLSVGTREEILEKLAVKTYQDFADGKISQDCYEQAKGVADMEALIEQASNRRECQERVVAKPDGMALERNVGGAWIKEFAVEQANTAFRLQLFSDMAKTYSENKGAVDLAEAQRLVEQIYVDLNQLQDREGYQRVKEFFEADLKQSGLERELNIPTPESKHNPDLTM